MPGVSLGENGRAQAARLAERFSGEQLAAIYSSPLERARETAEPIAASAGVQMTLAPRLNEIDVGAWTGKGFAELGPDPRWQRWNAERGGAEAPGGERMRSVQERVLTELDAIRLRHPGGRVVTVSHADVIKAAICGVLGLSLDRYHAFEIEPASISAVVLWDGGGKVLSLNERCAP